MDFFDKLGKKATQTYKDATEKTGKLAKEAKLKMLISDDKSQIEEIYAEIGKKVYQKHIREENINIKEELLEECSKIDVLSDEIETARMDILHLKDKKQCKNCFYEIQKEDNYCSHCGAKQATDETKEVEVLPQEQKEDNWEETKKEEENEE